MQRFIPIVTIALALAASGCREQQATQYYYPADLQSRPLPAWTPTNELPVSPNQAVSAALEYVSREPDQSPWDVESIELSPIEWSDPVTWEYSIRVSRQSPRSMKIVRVLLDGKVWEPELKERE